MPWTPKRVCNHAGCNALTDNGYCDKHKRPTAAARGYGARWQKYRLSFLMQNPLCVLCKQEGRIEAAIVVDHITPHRGDPGLFWDVTNHRGLCVRHHNAKSAKEKT